MNRDAKGRFTTRQHADADVEAAERLLERAVEEARKWLGWQVIRDRHAHRPYVIDFRGRAEDILRAATESADLLMRRAG